MFSRSKKTSTPAPTATIANTQPPANQKSSPSSNKRDAHNTSAPPSLFETSAGGIVGNHSEAAEVRQHALAAVVLEEWMQELAALAQEHSVLQKERAFEVGMGLS